MKKKRKTDSYYKGYSYKWEACLQALSVCVSVSVSVCVCL